MEDEISKRRLLMLEPQKGSICLEGANGIRFNWDNKNNDHKPYNSFLEIKADGKWIRMEKVRKIIIELDAETRVPFVVIEQFIV